MDKALQAVLSLRKARLDVAQQELGREQSIVSAIEAKIREGREKMLSSPLQGQQALLQSASYIGALRLLEGQLRSEVANRQEALEKARAKYTERYSEHKAIQSAIERREKEEKRKQEAAQRAVLDDAGATAYLRRKEEEL